MLILALTTRSGGRGFRKHIPPPAHLEYSHPLYIHYGLSLHVVVLSSNLHTVLCLARVSGRKPGPYVGMAAPEWLRGAVVMFVLCGLGCFKRHSLCEYQSQVVSLSHTHTCTLSHMQKHSLTHSLTHSLAHTLTHTCSNTLSLSPTHTHTHIHSLHTHSHTLFLSLSLSLSLSHTHTHTHTNTHTHTHTHTGHVPLLCGPVQGHSNSPTSHSTLSRRDPRLQSLGSTGGPLLPEPPTSPVRYPSPPSDKTLCVFVR